MEITRSQFAKGYAIYAFSLVPSDLGEEYLNLVRQGNVRLEVKFAASTAETLNCLAYAEFPALLEVDLSRDIKYTKVCTPPISCVIKGHYMLSKTVRGVFSSDTLPSRVNIYPSAYVCNRNPHISRDSIGWSFGWKPSEQANFLTAWVNALNIMMIESKTIIRNSEKFRCNEIRLQKSNCTTCGYHVLFYLLMKCRHYTLSDIVRLVSMQDDPDVFV